MNARPYVTVGKGMARYKITVHTSDVDDAGTDGDVYVRLSYPLLEHDATDAPHDDERKRTTRKSRKSKKEGDADDDEGREWTDWAGRDM